MINFPVSDWMPDAKIPSGPIQDKWSKYKLESKLINPNNKRKYTVLVVGSGLAGASAAATLAELGYNVKCFCYQDSPRRAQGLYRQLIGDRALFTWLDDAYLEHGNRTVERTTSRLEGGPNNAIKHLLRHHRGLSNTHAPRAVDWLLNSLTEQPHDPWQLAKDHLAGRHDQPANLPTEYPTGPVKYETGLSPEEGLWTRKGWAGRS